MARLRTTPCLLFLFSGTDGMDWGVAPPGLQPRRANGQAIEQNGLAKRGSEREWAEDPFWIGGGVQGLSW